MSIAPRDKFAPHRARGAAARVALAGAWFAALWLAASAVSAALAQPRPAEPPAVALVVRVSGDVQVRRAGLDEPMRRYDTIARGEVIRLARGAELDVLYPAARSLWTARATTAAVRVRADAQALRAVDAGAAVASQALPAVYREVQVDAGAFAQAALVLRGDVPQPRFALTEPVLLFGEIAIDWLPPSAGNVAAPVRYLVDLIDAQRKVVESREQTATSARWSSLAPGPYLLRVSFDDANGRKRSNTLRFTVASAERAAALRAAAPAADASAAERAAYEALRLFYAAAP